MLEPELGKKFGGDLVTHIVYTCLFGFVFLSPFEPALLVCLCSYQDTHLAISLSDAGESNDT